MNIILMVCIIYSTKDGDTMDILYAMGVLGHNNELAKKAESILKSLVENNSDNQKSWVWIETVDGEIIKLKPGFKIGYVELLHD